MTRRGEPCPAARRDVEQREDGAELTPEPSPSRTPLADPADTASSGTARPARTARAGPTAAPPEQTAGGRAGHDADVVIDLTGSPPPRPAGALRSLTGRHRRSGIALGAVALIGVVLAIVNFAIGMQWRSVAMAAQDRAALAAADAAAKQQAVRVAREARDVSELRREAMAKQLAVSEADVAALEARVAALASDKARAEDYGAVTRASSSGRLRALQAQLDSCITQIAALRTSLRLADPASTALDEEASAAQASCEQAGADVAVVAAGE